MERQTYLSNKNYKKLHDYLNSILFKVERNVTEYVNKNELQDLLIKKVISSARTHPTFCYSICYDFFEEAEEIGYKETQVSFIVIVTLEAENSCFDFSAGITSMYETNSSGWYKKIMELPSIAIEYFENIPVKFIEVLDDFFAKEFKYRKEERIV